MHMLDSIVLWWLVCLGRCVIGSSDVHIGCMDMPKKLSTKTGVSMLGEPPLDICA